jgi:hypothetical protein
LEARSTIIPNFVKAASPLGLRRLMLLTAAKLGGQVTYYSIQHVNEGRAKYWIAWFNHEITNDDPVITGEGE